MSSRLQLKQDLIDRSLNIRFIRSFHHQFLNLKLGFNHNNEIKNNDERRTKSKDEENNIFYILFFIRF